MHPRRAFVLALIAARSSAHVAPAQAAPPGAAPADAASSDALRLPFDFGAHPASRIEWWYLTGGLDAGARSWGFQITFFRAATAGAARAAGASRFAPQQIVFAHAAVTDLEGRRLRHDQRIARAGFGIAEAKEGETALVLRDWRLERREAGGASRYDAVAASDGGGFSFRLGLAATQPVLLQGLGGVSQKGPRSEQSSRYYSEPQLAVTGTLALDGRAVEVTGRAWLDHEWSDSILDAGAVGWDWLGINLDDGAALTAFRLRRADGSTLWSGGSHRAAGGPTRNFADGEVVLTPGRAWQSPATKARYPVEWRVVTPSGSYTLRAMLDDQELDSRASTGAVYWEGLSLLGDQSGRRLGRGYLEMTGYASRLVL